MARINIRFLCSILLINWLHLGLNTAMGQVVVNMQNGSTTACEGIFMDSDAGQPATNYDHNENLTYTICVPTASAITLSFSEFCTEPVLDELRFFDGPTANSPEIGSGYSGSNTPAAVVASSGCLTITFTTDANVACTGWLASWETDIPDPVPPVMSFSPTMPNCNTATATLLFDYPIVCDSVYPGAFQIDAPNGLSISSITPINCLNGLSTQYQVNFAPGMNESGTYDFEFTYRYKDPCDRIWVLQSQAAMEVNNCPLVLELSALDTFICPGSCTQLIAKVTGGTGPGTYTYSWGGGVIGTGDTVTVCISANTLFSVTVDDAGPSPAASATILIQTLSPPVAQPDFSTCQNIGPYQLTATPAGGIWSGEGIEDENTGRFVPWNGSSRFVYYEAPNGCFDSVYVTILSIWAGPDEASCPGAAAFQLATAYATGGTWTGPNVTPTGTFDPIASDVYTLTYTAPNGCIDYKDVNVDNILLPQLDSVCESQAPIQLSPSPFGGNWSGNGITDGYWGIYDPATAGAGLSTLTYTINGCNATLDIFVKDISVPNTVFACPLAGSFDLPPALPSGGVWSGIGITNPVLGSYSPSLLADGSNDNVLYTVGGCFDTVLVKIRLTEIDAPPLVEFCPDADTVALNVGFPEGGIWSGTGVTVTTDEGIFDPQVAGSGSFTITYTVNGCSDSTTVLVRSRPIIQDTSICPLADPFLIAINQSGGTWYGDGITDENTGEFDPGAAEDGPNTIWVESNIGCWDSTVITIVSNTSADIAGLEPNYCYLDTLVVMTGEPLGGTFSGTGVTDSIFNPIEAGPGSHTITYSYGIGNCLLTATKNILIKDSIQTLVSLLSDSVCYGKKFKAIIIANGGSGDLATVWTNPVHTGNQVEIIPESTDTLVAITTDGCSQPKIDSIPVYVYPKLQVNFNTSEAQCYGQMGYATVASATGRPYSYQWENAEPSNSDSITAQVGYTYKVRLTDIASGCQVDTAIVIPGFSFVQAYFTPNPDGGCIPLSKPDMGFVDLSTNGVSGIWDFGDGNSAPYEFGTTPANQYADTGQYTVTLKLKGEGNCTDSFSLVICVAPEFKLFIPNAFSPNAEGPLENEVFQAQGIGIESISLKIFNRWGQVIKVIGGLDETWDGTYLGKPVPAGFYVWGLEAKGRDLDRVKYVYETGKVYVAR